MIKPLMFALGLALTGVSWGLELETPSVFDDHMVLQRDQTVPIWGTTEPGATVFVRFAGQEKAATADADGAWRADLSPMDASAESRTLTIVATLNSDTAKRKIEDVLVGEVWFAGGQSNMYRPFRMLTSPAVEPKYEPIAISLREEAARANDPLFRQYRVGIIRDPLEAQTKGRGEWSKAITGQVNEFCGTAYFFGRELRRELGVPVALISCNLGGTRIEPWIAPQSYESSEAFEREYASNIAAYKKRIAEWDETTENAKYQSSLDEWEKTKAEGKKVSRKPRKTEHPSRDKQVYGTLYNGMVHPLIPYGIRGALWYQGESNTKNFPDQYDARLAALINGWREAWGQEKLYFFWCQLANYRDASATPVGDEDTWAVLQDRQRRALALPDTGMAVLNDIGEAKDIHPKNKEDAGKRLSLWALKQAYGNEVVCSGPLFKEATLSGSKVTITFDHAGTGLMIGHKHLLDPTIEVDEPLKRFQICGADRVWRWAESKIVGENQVVVWNTKIKSPVEVRYAWASNPEGANLYNREGLPASLFTTGILAPDSGF